MRATQAWGRAAASGRVSGALLVAALPVLALSVSGSAASAAVAAGCRPGSGVHLAGQRPTDTEIQNYSLNGQLRCADLEGADLSGLSFIQADLTGANLRKANLSKTDFGQATLSHAQLQGAKGRAVDFIQATMIGANLSGANLRGAKFGQATMTGANLSKAVLISADFGQTTISKANFTSANLTKSSLTEATAKGANFAKTNLTDASFISADLTGAHFKGAKLKGTDFTSATSPPSVPSAGGGGGGNGGGGPSTLPGIGNSPTVSGPPIDKAQWLSYLLIGSALLFALMAAASVRRFFSARVRSAFLNSPRFAGYGGGYGAGGSFGPYSQGGPSYGPGGSFGPYGQGGGFNAGFGPGQGGTTAFDAPPGGGYGPMPGVGGPGGVLGGGVNPTARPYRLVLAIAGALVTAIGIWLIGHAVINAILVPVGTAFQLCESTCSSRFGGSVPVGIVVGVVVMIVGGILRRIGTVRFYY